MVGNLEPEAARVAARMYNHGAAWEECAAGARIFQAIKKSGWNSTPQPVNGFETRVDSGLPALAWLCEIKDGIYSFVTGPRVEHGKNFIVEGVWDGDFADAGFTTSDHFYGSGTFINERNVCVFAPPRLCTDYLFVLRDKQRALTFVSNSFNFILARADIGLEGEFYREFSANINRTTNEESGLGADRGSPLIAETGKFAMYRMMYHNFSVDASGKINYLMRLPQKLSIPDFDAYKMFLHGRVRAILANGSSPVRKNPLGAITMLSTGYDSCAVSAICARCGVRDAITLDVKVGGHHDCGASIADALGLNCHRVASPLGRNVPVLRATISPENANLLEFMATPGIGDNVAFLGMEPYISGKIVFSGLYGDGCWSKAGNGSGLAHHLPYMKSRVEFRLRTGYFLAPPPAFGAYFPYVLNKINASEEMRPWTLNNNYDRPIPRRLAEEAGVPRHMFGMRKAANNPDIINWRQLFEVAVRHTMKRYGREDG